VPPPGGGGGVHQVQAEHEAAGRGHVHQLDDPVEGAHDAVPPLVTWRACPSGLTCPSELTCPSGLTCPSCPAWAGAGRRRDLLSSPPVTTSPPTTFMAANAAAMKART